MAARQGRRRVRMWLGCGCCCGGDGGGCCSCSTLLSLPRCMERRLGRTAQRGDDGHDDPYLGRAAAALVGVLEEGAVLRSRARRC